MDFYAILVVFFSFFQSIAVNDKTSQHISTKLFYNFIKSGFTDRHDESIRAPFVAIWRRNPKKIIMSFDLMRSATKQQKYDLLK